MGTSNQISLGSLRLQSKQRADLENNPAVSDSEWNSYITNSRKELYDVLLSAYDNNYNVAPFYNFILPSTGVPLSVNLPDGTSLYQDANLNTLPAFYKALRVDIQAAGYSSNATGGWVTLQRFNTVEENKYAYQNTVTNANYYGYTNLRYQIRGDTIVFTSPPTQGQFGRLLYSGVPNSLQYQVPCGTTISSTTVTLSDTNGITVGMQAACTDVISENTTVLSVGSTSLRLSMPANLTKSSAIISFWSDATLIDGVSGWEEMIIVDAAIKANIKQEEDIEPLISQKNAILQRIQAMAEARDIGQAFHVSDVLGRNGYGSDGYGDGSGSFGSGGW